MERRGAPLEIRAASRGRRLEGYVATFAAEARVGGVTETIAPGAFAETLRAREDVVALVDHDAGRVLARTRSGTLRLAEDSRGLAFDLDVPDTSAGRDVLALAERGDLGGMSFGFVPVDAATEGRRRVLRSVRLMEVSVVSAWPAYQGTMVEARAQGPADGTFHPLARWRA